MAYTAVNHDDIIYIYSFIAEPRICLLAFVVLNLQPWLLIRPIYIGTRRLVLRALRW